MASLAPLVIKNGQVEQLQTGDTISVSSISGGTRLSQTNDTSGTTVCGSVVYNDAADGFKLAKADASGTCKAVALQVDASILTTVAGYVQYDGILALTTTQWDAIWGTSGGLTPGAVYYLSAGTAGAGTATAPTTVGQYVVELGLAVSTTEFKINIRQTILL